MNNYSCPNCKKLFNSALGLAGHKRMHGPSGGKIDNPVCCCLITRKELLVRDLEKYQRSLKPCKNCQVLFKPSIGRKTFCGQSCSASFTNRLRGPRSNETKQKISKSLTKFNSPKKEARPKNPKKESVGPYSKLFVCSCKHCQLKFVSRVKKQYCTDHKNLYSYSNKSGYKFTFNVFHYPDLFDINLLKNVGWFSPGGKAGKWNPNGLSRDHKVSVNDAISNDYDPYYITHPLNCELMPHIENNKKKTKSSITYNELVFLVDEYDKKNILYSAPR